MTNNRNLALGGAALLIVGLFCPIVTLPFLGNINLFNDGTNLIGLALFALAVVGGAMALNNRQRDAFWPGLGAAAILGYHFAMLQFRLSQMRSSMADLEGNPFAGVAKAAVGTIQLQWGWLVLAIGVGLLIYASVKTRREIEQPLFSADDTPAKTVAGVAMLLAVGVIGWTLFGGAAKGTPGGAASMPAAVPAVRGSLNLPSTETTGPSAEEATYIRGNLQLYDLETKYYDSLLDGRVPGVNFKIKNNGNRTLNRVKVRVVFQDAMGKPIAEEEYNPVIVVENGYSSENNTPLRPNYIWQNERDHFYNAKSVPSEWAEGKATATITGIEFAPNR
ncbi:MAG: hypothetical protein JWL96_3844 [Sphingomonas bacterium]|uniref:hypothetical protein n=1 Tax=Sphingomonas bacterium TaxID=1895847 RepID=UPI00260FD7BC|nr:hypothetical protein [Sphingomonas bacterium]MDB5711774.1 hypothetical protein [Sphingomonas bacterium]